MRKLIMRKLSVALLALLSLGSVTTTVAAPQAAPTPTKASEQPNFAIVTQSGPDQWNYALEMKPGESKTQSVAIVNGGDSPIQLRTYATNALSVPNGGFGAGDEKDDLTGATRWLNYPASTVSIDPHSSQDRKFTVSVPDDVQPGQYVTALIVQTNGSLPIPGSKNFRQIIRKAMRVMITVPGQVKSRFELGTPQFSTETSVRSLVVPITNTGNILVEPEGALSVSTTDGKKVMSSPIKMGAVYGGTATTIQLSVPDQFPTGDYLVSLDLKDAKTGASAAIEGVKATLAPPKAPSTPVAKQVPPFVVDQASITPSGNPIQYADVAATVTNNGQLIPTANVTLVVKRDGKDVEQYALAQNQALPNGQTKISQRYIPKDGWKPGKWTFQIVVSAVSIGTGTQTVLATVDVPGAITIP